MKKPYILYIYDVIGLDVTPQSVIRDLSEATSGDYDGIELHISSPGGSVIDGFTIYSTLEQCKLPIHVYIDGIAASMGSVLAMLGDKIYMSKTAIMMIHKPYTGASGNADDLRSEADLLDKFEAQLIGCYMTRAKGLTEVDLQKMLKNETWLNAEECLTYGFCDSIIDSDNKAKAMVINETTKNILKSYSNLPDRFKASLDDDAKERAEILRYAKELHAKVSSDLRLATKI